MILQPTIVLEIELTARYCHDKADVYCPYKNSAYCSLFKKDLNISKSRDYLRLKECKKASS